MSKKILPLSEEVRAKLRSGITINTTAQCVEELVLNSLDAGATCVAVRIDLDIFRIQVVDNGSGISKENIKMLGKRYATSKCHSLHDLNTNLGQYGFRGEAVASLVDVAGLVDITTKHRSSTDTYTKLFAYGKEKSIKGAKVSRPTFGTTVTVQDFMYNMPVRRKRIKESIEVETICRRLESFALINPEISFSLRNDRKDEKVMQTHKGKNAVTAFMQLYGHDRAQSLVEVAHNREQFDIEGYISIQPYVNKSLQYIYINKRVVLKTRIHSLMNDLLSHSSIISKKLQSVGVSAGSSGSGKVPGSPSKGLKLYGIFILNIDCPLDEYDICMDPSKTLVEFRDWHKLLLTVEEWVLKFCCEESIVISLDERYRRSGKEDNTAEEEISPSQPHSSQEKLQVFSLKHAGDKIKNTCVAAKEKYGRTITVHDFQSVVSGLPARRVKKTSTPENHQHVGATKDADLATTQHVGEISDDVMGEISDIENDDLQASFSDEDSQNKFIYNTPQMAVGNKCIMSKQGISSSEIEVNQSSCLIEDHIDQNTSSQNKNLKRNISQESEFHTRKKFAAKSSLDFIRQIIGSEDTIEELSTSHSSCEAKSDYECENNIKDKFVSSQNPPKVSDETLSLTLSPSKSPDEEVLISKSENKMSSHEAFRQFHQTHLKNLDEAPSRTPEKNIIKTPDEEVLISKSENKMSSLEAFRQFHQTHLKNLDEAPSRTPEKNIIKTPNAPPPIISKSLSPDSDNDFRKTNHTKSNTESEKKEVDCKYSDFARNRLRRDIHNRGFEKHFDDSDEDDLKEDNLSRDEKEKKIQKDNKQNKSTARNINDNNSLKDAKTLSSVLKEGLKRQQQKEKALNSLQKFQFKKGQTSKNCIRENKSKELNKHKENLKETNGSRSFSSPKNDLKSNILQTHISHISNDDSFHFSPVISIKSDSQEYCKQGFNTGNQSKIEFDFSTINENVPHTAASISVKNTEKNKNYNDLKNTVANVIPMLPSKVRTEIVAEINLNDVVSPNELNDLPSSFCRYAEKKSYDQEHIDYSQHRRNIESQTFPKYKNADTSVVNSNRENISGYKTSITEHNSQPDQQSSSTNNEKTCFEPSQGFVPPGPIRERQQVKVKSCLKVSKEIDIYNNSTRHQIICESQGFSCDDLTQTNSRTNLQFGDSEGFTIKSINPSEIVNNVRLNSNPQRVSSSLDTHNDVCETSMEKSTSSILTSASNLNVSDKGTNYHESFIVNEKLDLTTKLSSSFKESEENTNNKKISHIKMNSHMSDSLSTNSRETVLTITDQDKTEPHLLESNPSLHLSQLVYSESSKNDSEIPSSQISNENNMLELDALLEFISPQTISLGSQQIDYERDKGSCKEVICKENVDVSQKKKSQNKEDSEDIFIPQKNTVLKSTGSADTLLFSSDSQNENFDVSLKKKSQNKEDSKEIFITQKNPVVKSTGSADTLLFNSDSQNIESIKSKSLENSSESNCSDNFTFQTENQKTSNETKCTDNKGINVWKEIVDSKGRKVYINLLTGNSSYDPPVIPETPEQCTSQGMNEPPLRIPISDEPWFQQRGNNKNHCNDFVLSHGYSAFMSFKKRRELDAKEKSKNKSLGDKESQIDSDIEHESSEDITRSVLTSKNHDALQALLLENDNEEESIKWVDKPSSLYNTTENGSNITKICQLWEAPNFAMDINIAATESTSTEQTVLKKNSAIRVYNIVHPYKFTREMLQSCEVLGQLDKKFIACNMKYDPSVYVDALDKRVRDIVVLFDQHAVHERVRLENILADNHELLPSGDRALRSGLVTPPMEIYLQGGEVRLMEAYDNIFQKFGLQYVKINTTKVIFHSIPSCLVARDASEMKHRRCQTASTIVETLVREICHTILETGGIAPRLPKTLSHVLNSQACRGAVKFGDDLTHAECRELIKSLSRCQLPFQCAHGRPSIVPIVDITHMIKLKPKTAKPNISRFVRRMAEQNN